MLPNTSGLQQCLVSPFPLTEEESLLLEDYKVSDEADSSQDSPQNLSVLPVMGLRLIIWSCILAYSTQESNGLPREEMSLYTKEYQALPDTYVQRVCLGVASEGPGSTWENISNMNCLPI